MSEYEITGRVSIAADPARVLPWLIEAERLPRWALGIESVETLEAGRIRVIGASRGGGISVGWVFLGETTEAGPERIVRRYRLEGEEDRYERVVTYLVQPGASGATEVSCAATTSIPGLAAAAARAGGKAEQRALGRSLERLRDGVEGRRPGLLARLRDSGGFAGPL